MPTFTVAAELPASAPRVWMALKDSAVIVPKIAPHAVASMEQVDGPVDAVGSIRLIKLGSAAPEGAYVKEKLVALDQRSMTLTTEEVEGGHLGQGFTKWANTIKLTPVDDTSCKWESTVEYEGDNEAIIAHAKEGLTKLFMGLCMYINKTGAYA
ncbi:unnamed protein product [Calypogeia fissa]